MPFFPKVDKAQFSSSFEQRSDSRVSSVSSENIQGSSPFLQSLNEKLVDYIDYNELVAELFLRYYVSGELSFLSIAVFRLKIGNFLFVFFQLFLFNLINTN